VSIARTAVRGAAWTIATGLGSRALGLVGTLLIARFVAPDDYGEVSTASVYLLLVNQFTTLGVGQYVIARPNAGREAAFHATFFHLTIGVVALGGAYLLRGPLGVQFGTPTMGLYVPGLVISVLLDRVAFMPERILVRDMRFGFLGLARTAAELTYSGVSIGFAIAGYGATAIVIGNVARSVLRCAMMTSAANRRDWLSPTPIRREVAAEMFEFGLPIWIGSSANFASRRVDNILVARFFGPAIAGMYNYAYNLADVPAVQVGEQIGDVLLPSFAKMDPEKRADGLVRSTTLLALIMFPLAVGLGAVAPTAVHAIFDKRWLAVGPMLMYLSALSVTRPIGWTISSYLQARDRPRAVMGLECFKVLALVGAIVTLGRLGPLWTCAAVGVAFALHALASLWVVHLFDGIAFARMLARLVPPLLACVPLVGAVLGVRHGMDRLGLDGKIARLAIETAAGGVAYVLAALVIARSASRELLHLLRHALKRRRAAD